ncbi:antitoxin VapB [Ruminococcus sp. YRD2003]|uniref:type II toxin-antitoxin system antitoxin VapB n=1 Tax=Ruminococcus sp. YRD2003 TaxID=1452313 RepID=UPI0008BFE6E4|nr:AbrB/MazE/SpoVT family DNA-binding domain-containing protein [Lachnospiraceae bacterium]SEL65312.1 antitoxin VapB [Ruminococcus flavefaciens]
MLTAKLFTNGSSQAVRLPKEFRFNGTEVYVQKVGSSVMLVPKDKAWETFMEGINEFSDDYLEKAEERPANMQSPEEREKL